MLAPAGGNAATLRSFLRIGSGTVARHQLALALAMECQRIVCISRDVSPELMLLKQDAEQAGVALHFINGPRGLASQITATDEVIVVADGLLVLPEAALELIEGNHAVLVQPVESGTAAGFERIDINHASAGLLRIPGRLVDRLNELPSDCDTVSSLTRIALQAGVPQKPISAELRDGLRWKLIRNEAEAHAAESGWIGLHLGNEEVLTPGVALARLAVKSFGPAILHSGSGGRTLAISATALCLLALGSGWFGFSVIGLVLCALAWIIRRASAILMRVEQDSLALPKTRWPIEAIFGLAHDATIVAILAWSASPFPWVTAWQRAFAPLMLLCLLRLLPRAINRNWVAWVADRSLLACLLAFAAAAGLLSQAIPLLATIMALTGILWPDSKARLTRV